MLAAFVALTLAARPAWAIVGGTTNLAEFSSPTSQYYGMNWSYNYATRGGTSTAIGYFTLLTAAHYSMDVGYTFNVSGDTFRITSMEALAPDSGQGTRTPDLRVVHVENLTNQFRPLPGFYDLYTGAFSTPTSKSFVMVGTGDTGSIASTPYYTDTANTRALRWGTNRYDDFSANFRLTDYNNVPHSTQCIKMSYDRLSIYSPTLHESGLGTGDSGSGIFVKDGGAWKLAGIGLYRDSYQYEPDLFSTFYAASVPSYAARLYNILQYDMLPGDLNLDGNVDSSDFITLKVNFGKTGAAWRDGDFNGDGMVGHEDLFALQTNFDYRSIPHPIMTPPISASTSTSGTGLPEPGSVILLALGATALLRRRGRQSKRRNPDKKTAESGTGNKV
jgi:hypothetical protein